MGMRARGRVGVWLGLLLVAGCGPSEPAAPLRLSTQALDFEEALVGQRREARVLVLNPEERPRSVRFRSDSEAFLAPEPLQLPGLGFQEVPVRFAPGAPGRFEARLLVETQEGEAVEVRLAGSARTPPACQSIGPCRSTRLDLERGRCVSEPLPDGSRCGAGACGGTCAAGTCVTDSGALAPVWRYAPPEQRALNFPGLSDAEGHVYWLEYGAATAGNACELVSASREGDLRYRVPLGPARCASADGGTLLLAADQLVLGVLGVPEWRRREDGSLAWRPDLATPLAGALGVEPSSLLGTVLKALAASRSGEVYALVAATTRQAQATLLVRFHPLLQQTRVLRSFEPGFSPAHLVLDESDAPYVGDAVRGELRALAVDGSERWRSAAAGAPRAAWGGRVWTEQGQVLEARTGALLHAVQPPAGGDAPGPVGAGSLAIFWTAPAPCDAPGCSLPGALLSAVDLAERRTRWSVPASRPSTLLYTARGSVLLPTQAGQEGGARGGLLELSASGAPLQERPLCEDEALSGDWALHAGRVFATRAPGAQGEAPQLRAYDLPERVEAAPRGWTVERGSLGRGAAAH